MFNLLCLSFKLVQGCLISLGKLNGMPGRSRRVSKNVYLSANHIKLGWPGTPRCSRGQAGGGGWGEGGLGWVPVMEGNETGLNI